MDLKQAEDLKTNFLWHAILDEIQKKIYFETQKFLTCSSEELKEIQLKIFCYESLKNLPNDVIDRET